MKKSFAFLTLFMGLQTIGFSQSPPPPIICGNEPVNYKIPAGSPCTTDPWYDYNLLKTPTKTRTLRMAIYRIVRNDGIGAITETEAQYYFGSMRIYFSSIKIDFTLVTLDTIKSNELWDATSWTVDQMYNRKHNPDAINVYVNHSLTSDGDQVLGMAPLNSNIVYITNGGIGGDAFYHELGHAFGLLHTFAEPGVCRENIDQTGLNGCDVNARYSGDGLVDTPADYNDNAEPSPVDQCGNSDYNPDLQNIMSYWNMGGSHFSNDQIKLMHANLTVFHPKYMINETPFSFHMETRLADGSSIDNVYHLNDDKYMTNSEVTPLLPGETYSSGVFNTSADGQQHHNWNAIAVQYKPREYFNSIATQPVRSSNRNLLFSLTPSGSILEINQAFSTSIGLQDPWETKDQTTFKTLSVAKGIFKNEAVIPSSPEKPYYQIKADAMKSSGGFSLSFQNWSGNNIDPLANPNSLAPQPLVTNGIATITANYKAMLASSTTGWITGNQFVSENSTASMMYVSSGNLWLHRENGSDKKEILVSSSAGSISSYSVTANGNNRYWVLNNGTTTPVSGYELNGATGVATVPALSGLTSSNRIEIVRVNSTTPKLALITKIGSTIYKSIGTLTSGVVTWGSWTSLTVGANAIQVAGNGNLAYVAWIQGSSIFGYKLKTDGTWSSAKVITSSSSGYFTSMASAADPNGNLYLTLVRANTQTQKKDLGEGAWYINETTKPFTVLSTSGTYGDFTAVSLVCEGSKRLASVGVSTYIPYFSFYLWKHDGTSWAQETSSFSSTAQKLLAGEVDYYPGEQTNNGLRILNLNAVTYNGPPMEKITTGTNETPVLSISGVELVDTLVYNVNMDPAIVDSIIIDTLGVWSIAVKGSGFVTEIVNDLKLFGTSELIVSTSESGTSRTIKFKPNLVKWDVWVVDPSGNKVRMGKENSDEDSGSESIKTEVAVYPNPFNPETRINIRLAEPAEIHVRVYNVVGQLVADLANGHHDMGDYSFRFDGKSLASGTYFYRVEIGTEVKTGKIQLLK